MIAKDGKISLIGLDWLKKLNFPVAEANKKSENNDIVHSLVNQNQLPPGVKRIKPKISYDF